MRMRIYVCMCAYVCMCKLCLCACACLRIPACLLAVLERAGVFGEWEGLRAGLRTCAHGFVRVDVRLFDYMKTEPEHILPTNDHNCCHFYIISSVNFLSYLPAYVCNIRCPITHMHAYNI